MTEYSMCGIACESCKFKSDQGCDGCRNETGEVFWGKCELYECCNEKALEHCGECDDFPCDKLREWASSQNPERIDNLRKLRADLR